MLSLLLLPAALAAEIQVIADGVSVEVDGRAIASVPGQRGATARDLAGGAHRVQVFDARDQPLTTVTVSVDVDEQVRLELRRGQLTELGRGPLPGAPTCPPDPAQRTGGVQVTELGPGAAVVSVDGRPVPWDAAHGFLVEGLAPGPHTLRVEHGGASLWSGPANIHPGLLFRCGPSGAALQCAWQEDEWVAPPSGATSAKAGPVPMPDASFTPFVAALKAEAFGSTQLDMLRGAVTTHAFTIAQVGAILDVIAQPSDKVAAAGLLAPAVLDRQDAWQLDQHLTFESDKEQVQKLFR